jgi:GDP-L-fucose synthase
MIPAVIVKLHEATSLGATEIDIWGDGTTTREFMYAGDFADCIFKAIDQFQSLPALSNVGPGTEVSINSYYEKIAQIVGFKGRFVHDLSKPSGMARKVVDTSQMDKWGWKALTSLEEGLLATYRFYLQQEKNKYESN